jgi:hypothetical protein
MGTPEDEASYRQHLEAEVEKLRAKIQEQEAEIDRLRNAKGLTREDLEFNSHTGLWLDKKTGALYCPKCLDADKRNPLKDEGRGWRCYAGPHYFPNPDAPNPIVRMGRTGKDHPF